MKAKGSLAKKLKSNLYDLSTVIIFLTLILVFTVINAVNGNRYLTMSNLSVIINQASFLALLGVAQMVVLLTGGVNLSIGAIMVFSSIIAGPYLMQQSGYFWLIPVLIMLLFGGLAGGVNGILVTQFKLPAFIATFSAMYIFRGLAWIIQGRTVIYRINENIRFLAMGRLFTIGGFTVTMPMLISIGLILIMSFALRKTVFGSKVYFTGSNPVAAKFSGINVNKIIILIHILSGVLAGFCGVMYAARVNAAEPGMYTSAHFDAISVALIGGISMRGGFGNVWGVAIGALIISTIQSGMNSIQLPSEYQTLVLGLLIILSVFFNQFLIKAKQNAANELSTEEETIAA